MQLGRGDLVQLLQSRGSHRAAQEARDCLPEQIDIERDRDELKQCGIDPDALASLIRSAQSKGSASPTWSPPGQMHGATHTANPQRGRA